jgi:hypothetical protein
MCPIERPGRSRVTASIPAVGAASRANPTPKGPAAPQSLYLTSDRLHQISQNLDDRDHAVLRFVHQGRFATGAQLLRAFWLTSDRDTAAARAGRRALKRLADQRVLERLPRRIGGRRTGSDGIVYRVGRAGTRLLAAHGVYGPRTEMPGTLHLEHTLATTELALRLIEAQRRGELELIEAQQEPVCWRPYLGAMGARRVIKPDLFVRVGAGSLEDRWFLEIDLAQESGRTIARKAAGYLEHYRSGSEQRDASAYPRVLWLAPDEDRARQLSEVLERQPAEAAQLFVVRRFDETVAFIAQEARS